MKRVLIVSPHFPPINAPDLQRVRMSLPYFRAAGWEPVVLCVRAADVAGVLEPELLATIPSDVRVVRTGALPLRWTRRIGMGTLGNRAVRHLYRAGAECLRRERFDLIFFSTTQFLAFTLGPLWRRRFGVPYVLDFQDPWRTDYYSRAGARKPPGGWKYQIARLQARLFEGWTVRNAAGVISVSEHYVNDLRERYPGWRAPAEVIPFGASRADLDAARSVAAPNYPRRLGERHVVYTGASGPVTPHALSVLFEALRLYRAKSPDQAARLRFHFYGTSYVPPGEGRDSVMPLARSFGVDGQVDEIPHRLGHLACLRLQREADVLLLPGSSDLAYSPSKTYPYYLSGKPILGLVFEQSVLEALLESLRCAYLVRFRESESKEGAYRALHRFFDAVLEGFPEGTLPSRNETLFAEQYLAESLTRRQAALFEQALAYEAERRGRTS